MPEHPAADAPEPSAAEAPDPQAPDPRAPDPHAPRPLGVPRTLTGHAEVDAGLERLGDVDHLATDGHTEVYEDVHGRLRDTLTALDARQGPPAPGRGPSTARPPMPGGAPARPYDHRS
ncbi:hypothetical protein [Streptomyces sp. KLOTTS4A1]|uniref:hypothetical protein n=1 Tax=Streptomyces sp. KLOTTS4A1 TaxID=3390996 RepID=UPI0039F62866